MDISYSLHSLILELINILVNVKYFIFFKNSIIKIDKKAYIFAIDWDFQAEYFFWMKNYRS